MGYMKHKVVVVQGESGAVQSAHQHASNDLNGIKMGSLVTGIIPAMTRGVATFMIGADGSKEGFDTSNLFDETIRLLIHERFREIKFLTWAVIEMGGDDDIVQIEMTNAIARADYMSVG